MDEREKLVVKGITGYRKQDEIVMELCQTYGMSWDEAQRFVALVKEENRDKIVAKQGVFQKGMAIFFIAGGTIFALGSLIAALAGVNIFLRSLPIPYSGNILFTILGLSSVVGGFIGLFQKPKV